MLECLNNSILCTPPADMAQLLVVQHPQNKEVIMNQRGKAHLIGWPR